MASTSLHGDLTLKTSGRDFIDNSTTNYYVGGVATQASSQISTHTFSDPFVALLNHTAASAMLDSSERCDAPKCHPETRVAVQGQILGWAGYGERDRTEQRILRLSGPAGAGKTAIMGTVADTLKKDGKLAASFFFSSFSGSEKRRVKDYFVTTLAYQLTQHHGHEALKSAILSSIEKDPSIFKKSLKEQVGVLILKPLREVGLQAGSLPEIIVVDGLDECGAAIHDGLTTSERFSAQRSREGDQVEILNCLQGLTMDSAHPLQVILASRPEPAIERFFSSPDLHVLNIFLDEKFDPDTDIALFLRAKFAQIRFRNPRISSTWPSEAAIQQLVRNASGQFIYAATIIRFVETPFETPQRQLEIVLRSCFSDSSNPLERLDILYAQVVKSSPKPILALKWLKAYCNLDVEGFGPKTAWFWCRLCESSEGEAEFLLMNLSAILRVSNLDAPYDASVTFYHKSFQDFLSEPRRYRAQFSELNDEIAQQWLIERFDLAFQRKEPRVQFEDPYFRDVFTAITPLYWRGSTLRHEESSDKFKGVCDVVHETRRFTLEDPTTQGLEADIVILILGRTGSGKSSFVNWLVGWNQMNVSHDLKVGTRYLQASIIHQAPAQYAEVNQLLDGRRILFLDAPCHNTVGFWDTEKSSMPVLQWLEAIHRRGMRVGGFLYLWDMGRIRPPDPLEEQMINRTVLSWCGHGARDRVSFVTTHLDKVPGDTASLVLKDLKANTWSNMTAGGASVLHLHPHHRFTRTPEPDETLAMATLPTLDPWDIIHIVIRSMDSRDASRQPLLIQDELINQGLPIQKTTAGQNYRETIENLLSKARHSGNLENQEWFERLLAQFDGRTSVYTRMGTWAQKALGMSKRRK